MAPTHHKLARRADPYRDLDVIDERGPRTNQAVVAIVSTLGIVFAWPLAWALMAAQLAIGLTLGRRFCLPCLLWFEVLQPRLGEGRLEDSRAPRLANIMGVVFLTLASVLWWAGAETAGTVVAAMPAALAALGAITGFCAGCEIYRLTARMRGISAKHHDRIEPADIGSPGARALVQFTHPLCSECLDLARELEARPEPLITLDVSEAPDLARKYGIALVPTAFEVAEDGAVLARIA